MKDMNEQRKVPAHWVGLDVSKKTFDAALAGPEQRYPSTLLRALPWKAFPRTRTGVGAFLAWLDEQAPGTDVRVIMEATGSYSVELTTWLVARRPSLRPAIENPRNTKACTFELRVADLLKEDPNVLEVENSAVVANPLVAGRARIAFQVPPPEPKPKAGPPTGPLDRIEPRAAHATAYEVKELPDAVVEVVVGGESFVIASRFSTPEGKWATGSCAFFKHKRMIERRDEAIVIRDTFTNLTAENLPLMHRHAWVRDDRLERLWIAGLEQSAKTGSKTEPSNPTTYAATNDHGVGLLALDDVFRVHAVNYAVGDRVGLADNNLVLRPNAAYTAEWAIVPTDAPDYWLFINAARRLLDANFTIDGCFAFLRAAPQTDAWTDAQVTDFLRFKGARYACASIVYPRYKGHYTHGTSFQYVTHDNYRDAFVRWRGLVPDTRCLVYFHCFIDVTDEGPERFADARVLRPDGVQADYGKPHNKIYCPTETNSYGPEIAKNVDVIFDEIKADGVYWDEHEYSRWKYHYSDPWDGCSGDIDPKTMTIARLKSSVTLLSESWRVELAKHILARGPLIGNGVPYTRAMATLKFPCFVETGSITNCMRNHLYSPIALGDHLTERSEQDAYNVMLAALD